MLWPLANLLSIWWGKAIEYSKTISKFFIFTAFFGRLILLLMYFVKGFSGYFTIMILVFSFNSLLSPAQNVILQNKFRKENRGLLFGYTASIITIVMVSISYITGKLLDQNEQLFRIYFIFVGIMGFVSMYVLSLIKIEKKSLPAENFSFDKIFIRPIVRAFQVLKENKSFAIFQRNFFIYGFAYMILLPSIPKYLVDYLGWDYSKTFIGKSIISQLGILILAPLAGKLHDKKSPAYFTAVVFLILALYPIFLLISSFYTGQSFTVYIVYSAFAIFGIGMAGMVISWNISSLFFAGLEDVSMYQSVHVTLTGIRGLFFPLIGLFIMKTFGIRAVFTIAFLVFVLASVLSFRLYKRMKKESVAL
jgi:MFS family permease